MVSHCANPACGVPLQYLRDGRLYQFEVRCKGPENVLRHAGNEQKRHVSHYWLCGKCSVLLTLEFDATSGVIPVALARAHSAGA